jgi:hypothetical protein
MRSAKYMQLGTIMSFWLILVFLQYFWCYKIVHIIVKYVRGGEGKGVRVAGLERSLGFKV